MLLCSLDFLSDSDAYVDFDIHDRIWKGGTARNLDETLRYELSYCLIAHVHHLVMFIHDSALWGAFVQQAIEVVFHSDKDPNEAKLRLSDARSFTVFIELSLSMRCVRSKTMQASNAHADIIGTVFIPVLDFFRPIGSLAHLLKFRLLLLGTAKCRE